MLDAAKNEFTKFLTDVYFNVDNAKGGSPGLFVERMSFEDILNHIFSSPVYFILY